MIIPRFLGFGGIKMAEQSWYNSIFFGNIGYGVGIAIFLLGFGYAIRGCKGPSFCDVEIAKARAGYVLQEKDLNNNGLVEKFYQIDGKKAFVAIDGKDLEKKLENN